MIDRAAERSAAAGIGFSFTYPQSVIRLIWINTLGPNPT
jgi:hypothetical protein